MSLAPPFGRMPEPPTVSPEWISSEFCTRPLRHPTKSMALPASPQFSNRAPSIRKSVDAGHLDRVVVAGLEDVLHRNADETDVARRGLEGARVIDVDAVLGLALEHEVGKRHLHRVGEVQAVVAALDHGGVGGVGAADRHLAKAIPAELAGVGARLEHDLFARNGGAERGGEFLGVRDAAHVGRTI